MEYVKLTLSLSHIFEFILLVSRNRFLNNMIKKGKFFSFLFIEILILI